MSCEYCWDRARRGVDDYRRMLREAETNGSPCCATDATGALTLNARRLRAGQFWSEALQCDRRVARPAESHAPSQTKERE